LPSAGSPPGGDAHTPWRRSNTTQAVKNVFNFLYFNHQPEGLISLFFIQAKNFLSAVYNEGVPYDSLLAGQPSMPLSPSSCLCSGGMGGWPAGRFPYGRGSLSTGFLKSFLLPFQPTTLAISSPALSRKGKLPFPRPHCQAALGSASLRMSLIIFTGSYLTSSVISLYATFISFLHSTISDCFFFSGFTGLVV